MDDIQESFAFRMVRRRISLRNDHNNEGLLNSPTNRDLKRRDNILKAIEVADFHQKPLKEMADREAFDKSYDYRSTDLNESGNLNNNNKEIDSCNKVEKIVEISAESSSNERVVSYVKSFELGRAKWRGPVAENYLKRSLNNLKQIDDDSGSHSLSTNESNPEQSSADLLKVREGDIKEAQNEIAGLRDVENLDENFACNLGERSQSIMYSLSSLSAVIDDIEAEIKALELEQANNPKTQSSIESQNRIYPALENIKFEPTGWTPEKKCNSSRKKTIEFTETARFNQNVKNNYATDLANGIVEGGTSITVVKDNLDEITPYYETPKKTKRKSFLMKSIRKSADSHSTKIKFPMHDYENINADESRGTQGTLDNTLTFEAERFLQDALGDELYNTSVTFDFSEDRDRTNSLFNASDLVSKETTPLSKRIIHTLYPPNTDPPQGSSKFDSPNRSIGLYRSLSQRIKKKFRLIQKTRQDAPEPLKSPKNLNEKGVVGQLLQEFSVQQTLIDQASKALEVCCTTKEFMESLERVEVERQLLIASLRRTAALDEIKRVSSLGRVKEKQFLGERREITLKDIRLNLRKCLNGEPQEGETVEWFVVVVSQGLKVWATNAISCPIKKLTIDFPEVISIPNLTPKFKILVQVYSLKLKKVTYNHEDKYKIRREKRSSSCPPFLRSPMNLFKKSETPLSPKPHRNSATKNGHKSGFVFSGCVELFLHDLDLSSPWPLILVPENSILDRTIDLSLDCPLHLSMSHEGFLNHGNEVGGLACWNRRWCVLKGRTLMFWNYPHDQESKQPLTVIELINCVSDKITKANSTICSRPRTLLIETLRPRNITERSNIVIERKSSRTIVRNFLSFDNTQELLEWSTKLNHVVQELREWNGIGEMLPQISDL